MCTAPVLRLPLPAPAVPAALLWLHSRPPEGVVLREAPVPPVRMEGDLRDRGSVHRVVARREADRRAETEGPQREGRQISDPARGQIAGAFRENSISLSRRLHVERLLDLCVPNVLQTLCLLLECFFCHYFTNEEQYPTVTRQLG